MEERSGESRAVHVAAVHAVDGIRFLAAGLSPDVTWAQVAGYVGERAAVSLWPEDAVRVRGLLEQGRLREAVQVYFARVGDRWDAERLHTETVELEAG